MLRPALLEDIPAMHALRVAVRENRLSDPSRVTQADYESRLAKPGASWVAEVNGSITGFAIADFPSRSVWALFVDPGFEGRGIGRSLLQQVTQVLWAAGPGTIHLSTEGGTRAERLYAAAGWTRLGQLPNGEVHFVRVVPGAA
jgi:GNAT superfamily N-acetyltransferase